MTSTHKLSFLLVAFALFIFGCTGVRGPASPPISDLSPLNGAGQDANLSEPSQTTEQSAQQDAGHYLWAYHMIYVDPVELKFEILPVRLTTGHLNVLKFLEQGPCTDCVALTGITPSGTGTILVDVEITHPFAILNVTGFDVRGIAMFDGTHTFPVSGLITSDRSLGEGELVNADGFTTLYNPTTIGAGPDGLEGFQQGKMATPAFPTSHLNGYMRHITDIPENTRNAFYAGETITVTYEIDMPDTEFIFGYAVDASWVEPTTKPVTDPMTHFPPEANCYEPWKVVGNDFPIVQGLTDAGGSTRMTIAVYDWQVPGNYQAPVVECPELFDGSLTSTFWMLGIDGSIVYEVNVENEKLAPEGEYKCLIKVVDNENAGSPAWIDLTAYQVYTLEVVPFVNELPVASAIADPLTQNVNQAVHFADDGSYDPDGGDIVTYEWDWENDGTFDDTGESIDHSWSGPGTYEVQLRVTDDEGTTGELETPLEIEIRTGWARTWGGEEMVSGSGVAFDGSNAYVAGIYLGTADFDPGDGTDSHTSNGNFDIYLSKFDEEGNFEWVRTWGGTGYDGSAQVATDTSGYVYVSGAFSDTVDFDPGGGTEIHSATATDIFLSKFDENGDFLWVRVWGGPSADRGFGIGIWGTGNVFVCGEFQDTVDFDPGIGIDNHPSNGFYDAFLSKFNSDGDFQWARTWGGVDTEQTRAVSVDDAQNVYVTGSYRFTVDFDPFIGVDSHTSNGNDDVYLTMFDTDGNHQWANTWGGSGYDYGYGVVCYFGYAFVTGTFEGTVDFDPTGATDDHLSNGLKDAFVSRFAVNGDFGWARTWGGDQDDKGRAIALDIAADVAITGSFRQTVDFDPASGTVDMHTSNGDEDIFLTRFDFSGDFLWARTWGSDIGDFGYGVASSLFASSYVTGRFSGTVDFDPGPLTDNHTAVDSDAYLMRVEADGYW